MKVLFQRNQGKSWVKVPVPPGTKQGFTGVWIDELASLPKGLLDGIHALQSPRCAARRSLNLRAGGLEENGT